MSVGHRKSGGSESPTSEATDASRQTPTENEGTRGGPEPGDVFEVLNNRRRRYALHYLAGRPDETVAVSDLAAQVAAWENEKPVGRVDRTERKRVNTALNQFHLPKLADYGFVDYDDRQGRASIDESASELDVYANVFAGRSAAWGPYYVGVTGVGSVVLLAAWFDAVPFDLLPDPVWVGVVLASVLALALVHTWYSSRRRLGVGEAPPELRA